MNAFQVHSAALLQKSTREGFGLTVTEALWKTRPVVAGRVGGIVDQIQDGETGLPRGFRRGVRGRGLRGSSTTPRRRARWRGAARSTCASHFLTPRLLRDWLALFNLLDGRETEQGRELAVAGTTV